MHKSSPSLVQTLKGLEERVKLLRGTWQGRRKVFINVNFGLVNCHCCRGRHGRVMWGGGMSLQHKWWNRQLYRRVSEDAYSSAFPALALAQLSNFKFRPSGCEVLYVRLIAQRNLYVQNVQSSDVLRSKKNSMHTVGDVDGVLRVQWMKKDNTGFAVDKNESSRKERRSSHA